MANKFGGWPGSFRWFSFNFMFMIWDSKHEDLQLLWLSFKLCIRHQISKYHQNIYQYCTYIYRCDVTIMDNDCCSKFPWWYRWAGGIKLVHMNKPLLATRYCGASCDITPNCTQCHWPYTTDRRDFYAALSIWQYCAAIWCRYGTWCKTLL